MQNNTRNPNDNDFYCDEILSGKTPHEVVYETDRVLGFKHTNPQYADHIIVIPKQHTSSLLTVDDQLLIEILHTVQNLADKMINETGVCKIITNLGKFQNNKHLHWHLVSYPLDHNNEAPTV